MNTIDIVEHFVRFMDEATLLDKSITVFVPKGWLGFEGDQLSYEGTSKERKMKGKMDFDILEKDNIGHLDCLKHKSKYCLLGETQEDLLRVKLR